MESLSAKTANTFYEYFGTVREAENLVGLRCGVFAMLQDFAMLQGMVLVIICFAVLSLCMVPVRTVSYS